MSIKIPKDIFKGATFDTKSSGKVIVINYISSKHVVVKFENTETIKSVSLRAMRSGSIKDRNYPCIFGVGFIGYGDYKSTSNSYLCWRNMIVRCYNKKAIEYKRYGGAGIKVCDDWHCFQTFAKWYEENYPTDGGNYDLDKDINSIGIKIYSPERCKFVSRSENVSEALSKEYTLINPDGKSVNIRNMSEFCRGKDLNGSLMCRLFNGKIKSYKGWSK